MNEDQKLNKMAEISMLASKIGNIIMQDQLNMPECCFACGVAINGIMKATRDKGLTSPEKWEIIMMLEFLKGLTATTAVMVREK